MLLAQPFWDTKAPGDWSEEQLEQIFTESPWAVTEGRPPVRIYLATAAPMRLAEVERAKRRGIPLNTPLNEDYEAFLRENQGKVVVLAVQLHAPSTLADGDEAKRMEAESFMKIGRRKVKMRGHFPPTPSDPWLRLVFPRDVEITGKNLNFDLYLPGVPNPYRAIQLPLKAMTYKGRVEL
jgi:hypothetical protein